MLREIVEANITTIGDISWGGKTSSKNKWDIEELISNYENTSFSSASGFNWSVDSDNDRERAKSLRNMGVKWFKKDNTKIIL